MKNQKKVLKGYLTFLSGILLSLIAISFILIYANLFKSCIGVFPIVISFLIIICGLFLIMMSSNYNIMLISNFKMFLNPSIIVKSNKWFIQGVPNNSFIEFVVKYNQLVKYNEIIIEEMENGIYKLKLDDKILIFDMRGWIRKEYYMYEYLLTIIQLNGKNKIFRKQKLSEIKNLKIIFLSKNGKKRIKYLIKNYETCPTLLFKNRIKTKYKILIINNKNKVSNVEKFYSFN